MRALVGLRNSNNSIPLGFAATLALGILLAPIASQGQEDALVILENSAVGMGIDNPERQLHLRGNNATFRMDRDTNSAAFILTRTAPGDFGTVWKTFVVGADASGPSSGEFVINDLGAATAGGGSRRMTINNDGNVIFTGTVSSSSSIRYKEDVRDLTDASESLPQLRGVRYVRKDNGKAGLGLVAEEVAEVYPELVERDSAGEIEAVNYAALVAVLIEGYKEQEKRIRAQELDLQIQRNALAAQQVEMAALYERLGSFDALQARLTQLEQLVRDQSAITAAARF